MNCVRAVIVSIIAAFVWAGVARADDYPNRPITMIVAFPPGGADDATARIIQDPLQKALGQPIVIENVAGAGGTLAAAKAAKATPDGYTVLLHQNSLAAAMTLYPHRTFDAEKDFVTVGLVNTAAGVLAGRGDLPPNNFDELLRWIKTPGLIIKFGHPGVGSWGHLAGVLIAQELGMMVTQIPYRGAGPALVDLLGGQMDLSVQSAIADAALMRDKKLKGYAVVGMKEFSGLPGLKTLGELGYKKLEFDFWHALFAPAGTPRPIIDKLNAALRTAMKDERLLKTFADGGMDRYPDEEMTPEAAAALLKREIPLWGEVIKTNHISEQ
ncbi:MAG: tripartite tricarboxylate transporter substrate binding protein BugD [Hyphomicrobiales bacterium]|nr:tripartite tricarboxylate transporter substrate binding protein BugD [Hyphomicrobiales bacterium]MBV8824681.1 tripartite tricarboxylate transporter substrate binding protein BugD [Hyphomicrobiales bacterium]MBV9426297.1 tripartite tricarboxylate transporter substrate binding protein BugD [Bradyrhizobiaceae bacterium]